MHRWPAALWWGDTSIWSVAKPIILVAGALNATSLLLFMTVDDYGPWMFVTRALYMVSEIGLFTAFLTYAADTLPASRRAQGLAYYGLSVLIPIGAGSVLAELILDRWAFDGLFRTAFVCVATSWVMVWWLPRRPTDERGTLPRRSLLAAFLQRNLIPLWIITFVFGAVTSVLFTFNTHVCRRTRHRFSWPVLRRLFDLRGDCPAQRQHLFRSVRLPQSPCAYLCFHCRRNVPPVGHRFHATVCGGGRTWGDGPRNHVPGFDERNGEKGPAPPSGGARLHCSRPCSTWPSSPSSR